MPNTYLSSRDKISLVLESNQQNDKPKEIYNQTLLEKGLEAIKMSIAASYQERLDLAQENQAGKSKKIKSSLKISIGGFLWLVVVTGLFFLKSRFF